MMQVMNVSQHFDFGMNTSNHSDLASVQSSCHPQEASTRSMGGVRPADVICGREKISHTHVGNKRFRHIVVMFREEYQSAPIRDNKTNITCKVVSMVRGYGGRFLKQDEVTAQWVDIGDQCAREKVSHALRSAKDPNRPKIKKRREVKKYVPSGGEDELFETTLADQQNIFQNLMLKEATDGASINLDDIESLISDL